MSFIITVLCPKGIAMVADSRLTLTLQPNFEAGIMLNLQQSIVSSDANQKIYLLK
jgi:hypothetical protein